MGNFDEYENERLANDPVIRLHVEGSTDREVVLDWWLDKADRSLRIQFAEVLHATESTEQTRLFGAASGCTEVVKRLEADLAEPTVVAMGMVDRDFLLRKEHLDVFLDPDDDGFDERASAAVGTNLAGRLWVLRRWELENYLLLDLDVLSELARCLAKKDGDYSPAAIEAHLHALAEEQLPLVARSLCLLEAGLPMSALKGANDAKGRTTMTELVDKGAPPVLPDERERMEQRLTLFAASVSPNDLWGARSRVADGKWLLGRLGSRVIKQQASAQLRMLLAKDVGAKHNGPPPEVAALFRRMRDAAVQVARRPAATRTA